MTSTATGRVAVVPRAVVERLLRDHFDASAGRSATVLAVGRAWPAWLGGRSEWFAPALRRGTMDDVGAHPFVAVAIAADADGAAPRLLDEMQRRAPLGATGALIVVGVGESAGTVAARFVHEGRAEPLDELAMPGAGMVRVALAGGEERRALPRLVESVAAVADRDATSVWSRTIGAMGGVEAWSRATGCPIALCGAGRSGSMMGAHLVAMGVQGLTVIDPDVVEVSDLGEMAAVRPTDVGRPKAVALVERLTAAALIETRLRAVPRSVLHPEALAAVKSSEVIVSAVDAAEARRGASFLATIYMRPLLDVGAGIHMGEGSRQMGVDVRLALPGACLSCLGGLGAPRRAADESFDTERAGSLRSLNAVASALGLRLLEDLFSGNVRDSVWLRVEVGDDGMPTTRTMGRQRGHCPTCERLVGRGDAGLSKWDEYLAETSNGRR